MKLDVTESPRKEDEAYVIEQLRAFNEAFTKKDLRNLCVFARDVDEGIIGGLTGKTYWNYLEISFLWVHEAHRGQGYATRLMESAEAEARARGCENVLVDTFSFQALGFYRKLGYREIGRLEGYSGIHIRHYLHKRLATVL